MAISMSIDIGAAVHAVASPPGASRGRRRRHASGPCRQLR